ncbi:MAG: O-antigen ligase family protein [Actinobacteria bacterium]|nr:O-antigen ligase family protein [Actinomycetota bacterium]
MNEMPLAQASGVSLKNGHGVLMASLVFIAAIPVALVMGPAAIIPIGLLAIIIPYWTPERSLAVFLAATLLTPSRYSWTVGPIDWGLSRLLFVAMVIGCTIAWSRGEFRLRKTPMDTAIFLFVTAMLCSFAFNSLGMTSDQFLRAAKTFGFSVVEWFILFYLVANIPKDWRQLRRFVVLICALVSIVGAVGIIEYATSFRFFEWLLRYLPPVTPLATGGSIFPSVEILTREDIIRVISTTISPHEVGLMAAMTLPLVLYFLAYAKKSRKQMALPLIALALIAAALLLTVTRGAVLASVGAVLCLSILSNKPLLRAGIVIMASAALLSFALVPSLVGAVLDVSKPETLTKDSAVESRTEDWPQAFLLLEGHELSGIGLGKVTGHTLPYGRGVSESFIYTDNYYLGAIVEMGALGICSIALMWFGFFTVFTRRRRLPGEFGNEVHDLRIAILSSGVAFMIMCATFDALSFTTVAKFFWLTMGLGIALARIEKDMSNNSEAESVTVAA